MSNSNSQNSNNKKKRKISVKMPKHNICLNSSLNESHWKIAMKNFGVLRTVLEKKGVTLVCSFHY